MVATIAQYQFQAETRQLLDLMINSLYTNKEIFLRELISNASDAIDRLRFETLSNPELVTGDDRYEIRLEVDKQERTLTISDSGIGMSRDEVIAHIGTIAKSGIRELRENIRDNQPGEMLTGSIGQFGVGFYSAFMVADRVTLVTRRAGEATATIWESAGDGNYTLREGQRSSRGTTIKLHLRDETAEEGMDDYTDPWVLSRLVKKHSDFIGYPILCTFEREEVDQLGKPLPGGPRKTIVVEEKTLNSMKPLWTRPQEEVDEREYAEFYRHISDDWNPPFKTIVLKAEGSVEYQALLFIPAKAPYDLFYHASESGLRLYAKRVMIEKRCEELLPRYLRFVRGVVDSADLPLNISRQMLQQDRHLGQIRKWLTKRILDAIEELNRDYEKYLSFWEQFGRALKEGVSSDYDNKERLVKLLLFNSSNDPQTLTTLQEYVDRMKEDQNEIFYLTGESRSVVENSPHLETLTERGYEILYLIDPVDELLVQTLTEFQGKKLKSAGKGTIKLNDTEQPAVAQDEAAGLLEFIQKPIDAYVKQVRLSNRLVSSPACLVGTEMDYSPQLERLLQKGKGGGPKQRRILELNPNHEIFVKMRHRFMKDNQDQAVAECAESLFCYALLAEGSELPDTRRFNQLMLGNLLQTL
ncbi:MAG TPA: molecular chaperone HtpG [Pyrinomonadaceae bacterium]|nr:molecular chaperone HtpG [Pyrinomonadaceae bacterium]